MCVRAYVCVHVCECRGGGGVLPKGNRGGVFDESLPIAKLEWTNSGISLSIFTSKV